MSDREEIYAAIFPEIQAHFDHSSVLSDLEDATWDVVNVLEDMVPAKPRQITTVEELDALPVGSVILDPGGNSVHKTRFEGWCASNGTRTIQREEITDAFPATVLWEPLP